MTIIHSKNYSFRKKWELFIQKIIQLEKYYSKKYSFKKIENYSFKKIIHFFEKIDYRPGLVQSLIFQQMPSPLTCPTVGSQPARPSLLYLQFNSADCTNPISSNSIQLFYLCSSDMQVTWDLYSSPSKSCNVNIVCALKRKNYFQLKRGIISLWGSLYKWGHYKPGTSECNASPPMMSCFKVWVAMFDKP